MFVELLDARVKMCRGFQKRAWFDHSLQAHTYPMLQSIGRSIGNILNLKSVGHDFVDEVVAP